MRRVRKPINTRLNSRYVTPTLIHRVCVGCLLWSSEALYTPLKEPMNDLKFFFSFLNSLSPFTTTGLSGTSRSAFFFSFFPMWCGGAPGYFPQLPTPTLFSPSSFFWTPQHEYKHKHPWDGPSGLGFEPC
jgi:hypothetical protein